MRRLTLITFLSLCAVVPARAQEPCGTGADELAKILSKAPTCKAAVTKISDCAWGSSADTQFSAIVITKCERAFFDKLSPAAKKTYADEMQLCAYEYAGQEGTMYISAAALCQVDVAARFAADPKAASKFGARASFDCAKAQALLEKAICSDINLGHADIILSWVYSGLLKNSDEKERLALKQSEKQWLQSLPTKCGLISPPFSTKSINCARNAFEFRFNALDSCEEGVLSCLRNADAPTALSASDPAPRASFDCEAPSSALEIAICADAELGQLDIRLAQAYGDAKAIMVNAQNKDLTESEHKWLRFVNVTCPLAVVGGIPSVFERACLREAFQKRISRLQKCPLNEEKDRISCLNDFELSEKKQDSK